MTGCDDYGYSSVIDVYGSPHGFDSLARTVVSLLSRSLSQPYGF